LAAGADLPLWYMAPLGEYVPDSHWDGRR
jgi:hypothetical protein